MHPNFRKKQVIELTCKFCDRRVCSRGMKAVLLADTAVQLFSTDAPSQGRVSPIGKSYGTKTCKCKICDIGCTTCGNVVGYQVIVPCRPCLESCNNGHLFIFQSNAIYAQERIDSSGNDVMRWDCLPELPGDMAEIEDDDIWEIECCR